MGILNSISTPADLKALNDEDLDALAKEIRTFLVDKVAATGGHLGPNLGVVELTIGLHRVFDSPQDPIIFDTSHQSYVHKILTGRAKDFDSLRQKDGLSGYTCRAESEHDWTESSHASAALSYADGLSKAKQLDGDTTHSVVAVVGDGALTGGMCWEALNNIAAGKDRKVVVVVNDNGRSYSPTIGGFAENLAGLRMQPFYDRFMEKGKTSLKSMGWVGERTFEALHAFKEGVKSTVIPTEMFPELGMKYVGPVDGHNQKAVDNALKYAHDYDGPIIVHMVTEKGRGYAPAEQDLDELMHSTGVIDPLTGAPKSASKPGWTSVFSDELVKIGAQNENVVAITAAMAGPTGLSKFEANFPNRFFDVGIAEQHAVTSAAGLALGGKHPVVAIYSTFLNRAFDQLLMDVGMLNQPVTLVLDRSGVTGSDGASHNGVWDMALTSIVPGVQVAAPRDEDSLRELLNEAISIDDGPTVVRFPKGDLPTPIVAIDTLEDGVDVLAYEDATDVESTDDAPSVLIIAVGERATVALDVASRIKQHGVNVTVVDPRWIVPIPQSLVALSDDHDLVITIEDGVIHGGVGSLLSDALNASEVDTPRRQIAVPQKYLDHASRNEVLADYGLDADGIETTVVGWLDSLFGE
ncbi:1-Deoxy-D-xylulose 5-phosphate synthase [Corynebacterium glutamicum MB001]|uniref:1-deoxy-D-xylulose-5-phosphate synthase n=1 Tax=Corynebacterium glutamicum (strain ATCC 13032 / DSM 20300 / JCM 1318 / BCRC 11384 / CCUG 27702 / LMG 3730 / NBRC 12168 / NCIMB 10025 / NRRL B-2784 / 534) TaxID=196627 RepID=DXS_CORGL|nr:1-deoxy-D-xylulose-5-phosphate synthase [Corynebacterium glutamicum]Q8NPB2.1 RecName: Full=1-deoxy-D-xylulose-5-phosphate synthase; AltName: Full=1-deoxyxylulose-5-phosphate synthase; Short=DXP synthase; Short=DXPS [Corynebacterium glutamicum ATCC 13032]AGT05640.1 1-Deoxy-D-xylulose 5-phosphate synthase [Corynebacterium glutamicum MB001]ASW14290.1 1-Deoxy-D-xylulose 5-phosphate synthase [Corynebacterium glutamicum]AUI01376.1 1-deoxy-D-xylulose-5-phosphate synthase [Corynebacterium glutamicum